MGFVEMRNITLLIKPASARCQYRCRYCFYEEVSAQRSLKNCGMMVPETVSELLSKVFAPEPRNISFVFQGGEPLLAGREFYEEFVRLVQEKNACRAKVQYSLQTNGALLDEAYCRFFRQNGFLIGLSLDGPKELNDRNRVDCVGKSTFSATMDAARLLMRERVERNVLTVLTDKKPYSWYAYTHGYREKQTF